VDGAWTPTFNAQPLVKGIGNFQFSGAASTSFHALQFLLYTGVAHIVLVGQDLGGGYYHEVSHGGAAAAEEHRGTIRNGKEMKSQSRMWKVAMQFAKVEYPHVKITLVNPAGLKGVVLDEINSNHSSRKHPTLQGYV